MNRVLKSIGGLFHMFGGLVLYWTVLLTFGVRPAIVVAVLFIVAEGGWRLMTRRSFPPLWLFANGAALVFGAIDLWARTPFMLRYEGAILNLMTAGAFALGAIGPEPLVLKFARQRKPDIPADPLVQALAIRTAVAWTSIAVMLPFLSGTAPHIWLVAFGEGQMLGFAYCEPERMTEGTYNLLAIAVSTDRQRSGVGAALMRHVESAVREKNGRLLLVETSTDPDQDAARAFYLKDRFIEEARIRDFYAPRQTKVVFWKEV